MAKKLKLGKNATAVLLDAARRGGTCGLERMWGHGRGGGWFTYGDRDANAALKLRDLGLATLSDFSDGMSGSNGYTTHSRSFRLTLNEAGWAVARELGAVNPI